MLSIQKIKNLCYRYGKFFYFAAIILIIKKE